MKTVTKENFFEKTIADFVTIEAPERTPDYISYYQAKHRLYKDDIDEDVNIIEDDEGECIKIIIQGEGIYNMDTKEFDYYPNEYEVYLDCEDYFVIMSPDKEVSSEYWYCEDGITRRSKHWGLCASCIWTLDEKIINTEIAITGFCAFKGFKENC